MDEIRKEMPYNFRLMLLESLVRVNDWSHLDEIFDRVYDYKLDLTISGSLLTAMCEAFHWVLDVLYQPLSKTNVLGMDNKPPKWKKGMHFY